MKRFRTGVSVVLAMATFALWVSLVGPQIHVVETCIGLLLSVAVFLLTYPGKLANRPDSSRKKSRRSPFVRKEPRLEAPLAPARSAPRPADKAAFRDVPPQVRQDVPPHVAEAVQGLSSREREDLRAWLDRLLEIRSMSATRRVKVQEIMRAMSAFSTLRPVIRTLFRRIKKFGWEGNTPMGRWFLGGAALGFTIFGGAGIGVAAFGGAIGLPLWIVFGAGAAVARALINDLDERRRK